MDLRNVTDVTQESSAPVRRCHCSGVLEDGLRICRACARAASIAHYHALSPDAGRYKRAKSNARAKAVHHLTAEGVEEIQRILLERQEGRCACCDGAAPLAIEWSHSQTNDAGLPLLRALICRSCAGYVTRIVTGSRPVPAPKVAMLDEYLRQPLVDPTSFGLLRNWRPSDAGSLERTQSLADWFDQTFA